MKFPKISPQKILHIEMRAKRAVTIFTARLALKAIEKHKRKFFLTFKNGPWPHLCGKYIKCTNGYFEEKLEPNVQSTARLDLFLDQMKNLYFN